MILLSIDSSWANIGWAVFDDTQPFDEGLLASGTMRVPATTESEKVRAIHTGIKELIKEHNCKRVIIERPERFPYMRSANLWAGKES